MSVRPGADDPRPGPRVAVVGSGPAGCYVCHHLLRRAPGSAVDVYDALPTPFGLLRYGVAPDNPAMKSVGTSLERILGDERVRFFGDVRIGIDVTLDDLLSRYHAVVLATGAETSRRQPIRGDELAGSHGAAEVVRWYQGHPDSAVRPDLRRHTAAVVIGGGNVSVDISRILLTSPEHLSRTDVPDDVLHDMRRSRIRRVHLVARSDLSHLRATLPEIAHLADRPDLAVTLHGDQDSRDDATPVASVVRDLSRRARPHAPYHLAIHVNQVVRAIRGHHAVQAVELASTMDPDNAGPVVELAAGLVVQAIGHVAEPPADDRLRSRDGRIPNVQGQVLDTAGAPIPGLFVAGWAKRGATGVIGTNLRCAAETVATLLDRLDQPLAPRREVDPPKPYVDWAGWRRIDRYEIRQGVRREAPRVKQRSRQQLRALAGNTDDLSEPQSTTDMRSPHDHSIRA